jgi:phosphate transport system substrate-binding protein
MRVSPSARPGVRGGSPAAFDGRCIPPGGVAPPANIPDILGRRAWPAGRLARLGATRGFHHGLLAAFAAAAVAALTGCGGSSAPTGAQGPPSQINGAGATFPAPLYSKWFSDYQRLKGVAINYQSQGSGAGIRQLTNRTVFFGASDSPMTEEQMSKAPGKVLHLPTVLGAVVPVHSAPGVAEIKFTGPLLADIFLGKVTKWNDPALVKVNPGVALPATDITVIHRSDGSGTTFIFADYLAKVSPEWKTTVGANTALKWPIGVGAKGNEGVTASVKQTPGAIGYVELVYAMQNKLAFGAVQNPNGEFVTASLASVTAAAAGAAAQMPADFRVSLTNAPGPGAYPIASFTWLLLYEDAADKAQAQAMVDFLRWALTDGQAQAAALGYAPLPPEVVQRELAVLATIKVS